MTDLVPRPRQWTGDLNTMRRRSDPSEVFGSQSLRKTAASRSVAPAETHSECGLRGPRLPCLPKPTNQGIPNSISQISKIWIFQEEGGTSRLGEGIDHSDSQRVRRNVHLERQLLRLSAGTLGTELIPRFWPSLKSVCGALRRAFFFAPKQP